MKRIVLFKRLLQPLLVVGILAVFTSAFYIFSLNLEATQKEASYETEKLDHILTLAKNLVSDRVYSSMGLLKQKSYLLGSPTINGDVLLNRESVPNLQFGNKSQLNQTFLIDYVTNIGSGTATLFVKKEDAFIRIATNVRQKNNARAVGTKLDPAGIVIKHLIAGKSFYGVVDILGEPYISGYEPIVNANHQVIGAWYVGYKVNVNALDQAIKQWDFWSMVSQQLPTTTITFASYPSILMQKKRHPHSKTLTEIGSFRIEVFQNGIFMLI